MKITKILIAIAVVSGAVFSMAQFASASIPATGGTTITLGIPNGWASAYPPYGPSLPPLTFSSGVPRTISTASMGTYLYYSLACCATAQLSAISNGTTVTLKIYGSTYGAGEGTWTYTLGTLTCPAGYTLSGTVCNLNTGTIAVSSNIATSWTITPGPIFGSGTSWSFSSATSGPTTYTITWGAIAGYTKPLSQSFSLATGATITFNGTYTLTPVVPTVTTPTVSGITTTGATLGANVTSLGIPAAISARGTCWGIAPAPTTNCTTATGVTTGVFTHARTGMTPGTPYYYRGYAVNTTGTGYSPDGTFTTTAVCANGTTNYPTCSQCPSGQAYNTISSQCVVCTGGCSGAGDIYGNGATCLNGASNPPFCVLASCTLPWGASLSSGSTAPAYSVPSVISPATCPAPQTYTCTNGVLSGSTYTNQNCTSSVVKLKYKQF